MTHLSHIPRPEKLSIARSVHANLLERHREGAAEPALDGFIPLLEAVIEQLAEHVGGGAAAHAERYALLAEAAIADNRVDTWYRHIESYLSIEARNDEGPHALAARAAHASACPDGLAHVDARIVEENMHCRSMLLALRDPVHAALLAAIEFPMIWLDRLEAALDASEAAQDRLAQTRQERSTHVFLGRHAEKAWVDVLWRLRRAIEARAARDETARRLEGAALIAPLTDALGRLRAQEAARRTRRKTVGAPAAQT
ncbi:hypothetical protein [Chondromyces crocatus]|uniref:Uncharacterized protein n=1 Tax=Chondromyces crocatus TaxID=52 RepID=A0A0K1E6I0_CHOCO|nr:hypothetical protein [Chondromyces crocatus]AKT36464.1 uncharacterized protein CMC5_005790 [Chondromyces crocatus]